jgi:hypothetical protein
MRLLAVAALLFLFASCSVIHHNVAGRVFDCGTQQPIAGARVEIHQTDWGVREGGPVWDKDFVYSATTDAQGKFSVSYAHGSDAKILVKKNSYMVTQHFSAPSGAVEMGLLKGKEIEYSEKCRPLKDCLHTTMENGVQVTRDVCED